MADTKISALTAATGLTDDDLLVVVDGATTTKKITVANAAATTSAPGLLSAADKTKLDGIASGATAYTAENARDDIGAALVAGSNVTITVNDAGDTITIAASGGGSTFVSDWPSARAVSGAYYAPEGPQGGTMQTTGGGLNNLVVVPILLAAGTLDRIGAYHVGLPTASEVARLGIYNSDSNGLPSTLVVDAGTVDLSTAAAFKEITISQAVTAGLYWLACARQGPTATATVSSWNVSGANQHSFLNGSLHLPLSSPSGGIWNRVSFYGVASVSGALPATPTFVAKTNGDGSFPTWGVAVRYA